MSTKGELLAAVIDTVADGLVIIDRQGLIKAFNPACERVFGYGAAEVMGRNVRMLMPPPYREEHDGFLQHYRETGQKRMIGVSREVQGRRKDGTVFPMDLSVGEVEHGGELAFVGIIRDITEQKESYQALAEARAKAETASQAKSEFLSRMSHELRTPMNSILGFAQLLRLFDPDRLSAEKRNEYVDYILGSANHLQALIEDVLDLSRIEAGRLKLSLEPVRLADAVERSLAMTKPMAKRYGIAIFNRAAADTSPVVAADAMRLRQCIVNLLTNAIKYNRPEGRVFIDCAITERGSAQLIVEDTGIGVAEERLGELFVPFSRLHDRTDEIEGSGIGLAIAKQLIEAMHGTIAAESSLNVGSRFVLEIPLHHETQRPAASARVDEPAAPAALRNGYSAQARTVLYVEDNPSNVRLMEALFSSIPAARLEIASTAERGLEIARSSAIDAIILDINLPGMNGFDAISHLKENAKTAAVPVIGLSARSSDSDLDRASRLGFYRYLTKPVDVPQLLQTLHAVLKQTHAH